MQRLLAYLQKDWVLVLIVCVLTIPAFVTLFFIGYFPHHDDLQVMRIFEMQKCFADGQIPCRWVPDMGYGFGYPLFNFYPPLPFYVGAVFHTITQLQIIDTVKVLFISQFLLSASFMYLFAKDWWGKMGGVVSALFYTYAPYHAVDLYVRGALNEAWAMAFAPGVGWAMTRLAKKQTINNCILLAMMISGMLLSHNLMVIIFVPLFVLFGCYLLVINRSVKLLFSFAASGLLAAAACAFFSIPVLLEQKYVHIDTLFSGYFNYTQHFATLHQLFFTRFWGYGASVYGPNDGLAFPVGWIHWIGVCVVMLATVWFLSKRRIKTAGLLAIFIFYFWLSAFLTHERSTILWLHIKTLQDLQFPWRLLSTVTLCSSFLIGGLFLLPLTRAAKLTLLLGLLVAVFVLNIEFFHKEYVIHVADKQELSGKIWQNEQTAGIFDYLPIYAVLPPGRAAVGDYQILAGSPTISNNTDGTNWLSFQSQSQTDSVIRLNRFDFPNWQITIDGKDTSFNHDNYLGLLTFLLPSGQHVVQARLVNTPLRTLTNIISVLTYIGIAGWFITDIFRRRKLSAKPS